MSKKIIIRLLFKTILLFVSLCITSYCVVKASYVYAVFALIISCITIIYIYRSQAAAFNEFNDFVESVRYRDFTRHFNTKNSTTELQAMRKGFNEITESFKNLSKEKETNYQYLQKILELVDTGILSYEEKSGEVNWMNESLKKMIAIPYLPTIHSLSSRNENLYQHIIALKAGETKVCDVQVGKETYKLLLSATVFQSVEKKFHFIAFQNINKAMDETETKAWQKLLGVLTHEIMNSIAPISSLADTIKNRLSSIENETDYIHSKEDLNLGIETIKRRSEGLLIFAEKYRNLTKISKPILKKIYARDLFENIYALMQQSLEQKNIELDIILKDPNIQLDVDSNLVEQVLINLVLNSIEAVKEKQAPKIMLSAYVLDDEKPIIEITDNGIGIPEENMENIFIPFFSTRKNGNGIGLTLCKQIMILHQGSIQVRSKVDMGTSFALHFG
ncbi:MAG TPA: HAMP domain-containing sensor histidine kinase [Bacteroidia bacterium]|nr:HAMP domain-containing sensor histidine kinase [Bacteroidia bacterium]